MKSIELNRYRDKRSQAAVAEEFGLSQSAISQAERKGRKLFVEMFKDIETGKTIKRLIEIRIIREVAA